MKNKCMLQTERFYIIFFLIGVLFFLALVNQPTITRGEEGSAFWDTDSIFFNATWSSEPILSCEEHKEKFPEEKIECLNGDWNKYSLVVGIDDCDCGIVKDAIKMTVNSFDGEILDIEVIKADFVGSERFNNESECTKITNNGLTGYYCENEIKNTTARRYS